MYLLKTAGILHENPYTGDRIVKARLLHFSHAHLAANDHAPLQTLRGVAQAPSPQEPETAYVMTHRTTVAIKYLLDGRQKRSYDDSESDQEDQEDQNDQDALDKDQDPLQPRPQDSPISSAHASWLARLRLLSNQTLPSSSSPDQEDHPLHDQSSEQQQANGSVPLTPLQVHSRQPETVRFGIKARRELRALKAAQGHQHVIALLGWTGAPLRKEEDLSSSPPPVRGSGRPEEREEEEDNPRGQEWSNSPALFDTAQRLNNLISPAPLLVVPSRGRADAAAVAATTTTSDPLAMSLEPPPAPFRFDPASLEPSHHRSRRFSDSEEDDGSFLGESDLEDDDDDDGDDDDNGDQDGPPSLTLRTATTRVLDPQDLKQYYKAQPRIGGLLLPYMPLTLRDLIQSGWSKTRSRLVRTCMEQILEGLDWIHEEAQLIHRDISAGNILVSTQGWMDWAMLTSPTEDEKNNNNNGQSNEDDLRVFCTISDFGCAIKDRYLDQSPSPKAESGDREDGEDVDQQQQQPLESGSLYTFEVGTRNYRAPELLFSSQRYGKSVDMWSAGVLFAELFLGGPLFDADTDIGLICAIVKVLGSPTVDNWPEFSEMPDYGKLNFQAREVTPLSTLLLGTADQEDPVSHEEKETRPPPTRATKTAVDVISRLVIYSSKQRLGAREALDLVRAIGSRPSLHPATTASSKDDDDDGDDHVDIRAIQQTLRERRRREREERDDDGDSGGDFGFGFGFGGGGPSDSDDDYGDNGDLDGGSGYYGRGEGEDDGDGDRWATTTTTGETTVEITTRYRQHHRRPFVSQTEWVSDEEF
ncbi:Cyclin-dependent kinase 20 [Actinomortierella ambigua]|nr:Cyclin-dependent kinase 20 [Actinomortierella ambigua]